MRQRILVLILIAAPVALSAQGKTAPVLRVEATDYAFTASTPSPASGTVTVRLVNRGHETHHLELSPAPESMTLRRYYELATADEPSPLVHDIGGPNLTRPADSSEVTLTLAPGRYILTCWVTGTDGKPHIMRGMMKEIRVAEAPQAARPPSAVVTIRASDYAFDIRGTLRPGANVVAFENTGPQEHDLEVVRLAPGQTAEMVRRWAASGGIGSPTDAVVGGSSGIDKGLRVWMTLHLTPGRYALFCFVPDAKDGKMHLLHGMLREISVQ
jgi:hypothetical protein